MAIIASFPVVEDRIGRLRFDVTSQTGLTPEQALAAAPAGSIAVIPPGVYQTPTGTGNGFKVTADDITVEMAPGAEIQVPTWGQPGIDCLGCDGIRVLGGGLIRYVGTRGDHTGTIRGGATYTAGAGVYISGDRCEVNGPRIVDMPTGVYISSWDGATLYGHRGQANAVRNIETSGMDFGVLYTAQDDLTLDGIYGHDDVDDSSGANPTHVIYGSATNTARARGVTVANLRARNILFGQPYQFKYQDSGTMSGLIAADSRGILNLHGCTDLEVAGVVSTGTKVLLGAPHGAITVQDAGTARVKIRNVTLVADSAGLNQRMLYMFSADGVLENVQIISKRSSVDGVGIAQVVGDRFTVRNLTCIETGSAGVGLIVGDIANTLTSADAQVDGVRMTGILRGVDVWGPTNASVRFNRGGIASSAEQVKRQTGTGQVDVYRDNVLTVAGTPESAVTAPVGTVAQRSDGAAGTALYIKESGTGNTGWAALATGVGTHPPAGLLVPDLDLWISTAAGASGTDQLMLTYFTAARTETIGTLTVVTGTTAAGATPTLCRMGIYSVAANGDLTLVASTANDTALFAATSTSYAKALSASVGLTAGDRYAVGVLVVSAAAIPTFVGHLGATASAATALTSLVTPRRLGRVLSQTSLPSSVSAGSVSATAARIGVRLS